MNSLMRRFLLLLTGLALVAALPAWGDSPGPGRVALRPLTPQTPALARDAAENPGGFIEHLVRPGDTLSKLAEQYLKDARAWRLLMRYNRLRNPNLIYPGQRLVIPVGFDRTRTDAAIRAAQARRTEVVRLRLNTLFGADFNRGDELLSNAIQAQAEGQSALAFGMAEKARLHYEAILNNSEMMTEPSPLATIRTSGGVHYQINQANPVAVTSGQALEEGGEIVTAENGIARLGFADGSQLLVGPMTRLRINQARRTITGEGRYAFELFAGSTEWFTNPSRARWSIEGPTSRLALLGEHARISVTNGKVAVSAFRGPVRVAAGRANVQLPEGYGLAFAAGTTPAAPQALPAAPALQRLTEPTDAIGYRTVETAAAYRLEVARDVDFRELLAIDSLRAGAGRDLPELREGLYYLRLAAVTADGISGPVSAALPWREDRTVPALVLISPDPRLAFTAGPVVVQGRSEPGVTVTVNDVTAFLAADGTFTTPLDFKPGLHVIEVKATDRQGNVSRLLRSIYVLGDLTQTQMRAGSYYTRQDRLLVTMPAADGKVRLGRTEYAAGQGVHIPIAEGQNDLLMMIPGSGSGREVRESVFRDQTPPEIQGRIRVTTQPDRIDSGRMEVFIGARDAGVGLAQQAEAHFYSASDRRYTLTLEYDESQKGYVGTCEINAVDLNTDIQCAHYQVRDRLGNFTEAGEIATPY